MIIEGWMVRADQDGNMLRVSRDKANHYVVTIVNRYAIDIEMPKEQIDKIPKDQLQDVLIETITNVIKTRGGDLWK